MNIINTFLSIDQSGKYIFNEKFFQNKGKLQNSINTPSIADYIKRFILTNQSNKRFGVGSTRWRLSNSNHFSVTSKKMSFFDYFQ